MSTHTHTRVHTTCCLCCRVNAVYIKLGPFYRRGKRIPRGKKKEKHKDIDSACLACPKVIQSGRHQNWKIRVLESSSFPEYSDPLPPRL